MIKITEMPKGGKVYTKKTFIKAIQMEEDFEVDTLEGTMRGKKGDYLLEGIAGELYPCRRDIFLGCYEELRTFKEEK